MASKRTSFLLPEEVLEELHRRVPRGQQSRVVTEAVRRELKRMAFEETLDAAFGAWAGHPHPELADGTETFIRRQRRSTRGKRRTPCPSTSATS